MRKCKLGDIAEFKTGPFGTQFKANEYTKDGIPVINVKNIGNGKIIDNDIDYISPSTRDRLSRHIIHEKNIVFARKGSVDRHAYIKKEHDGWVQGSDCIKTDIISKDDPRYISYYLYLDSIKEQLLNYAVGSTMPSMNPDLLRDLDIMLPDDVTIEFRVSDFLDSINNKIENNDRINAILEAMAKTLYDYWFVQFDFPDENGRPYKTSGGKMVYNAELDRDIPAGWEVGKLGNLILQMTNGLNPRTNFKLNTGGDILYLTVKNLLGHGNIDFSNCDKIDEAAREKVNARSQLQIGDILFASIAPLGRCYLIEQTPLKWNINESVFSIRPNTLHTTSEFLYMFLTSEDFIKRCEGASAGSIFKGIRVATMLDMDILIPPLTLINQFTNIIKKPFQMFSKSQKESQILMSLRDFLLPMLMNGQVTFKDDGADA